MGVDLNSPPDEEAVDACDARRHKAESRVAKLLRRIALRFTGSFGANQTTPRGAVHDRLTEKGLT